MIPKASARRLATLALEMGAEVLRGPLERRDEGWAVGDTDLGEWLEKYSDCELILIAASIREETYQLKTCGICGREYEG
ncbi:MAG: hypothetical protein ACETWB_06970, partial [Anaerolineae bacterium]